MKKLCHIIGFPIISKLIRGHTVELDNVCFIPDDQLLNESKELYGCLVEPQNTDTKEDSQNVNQHAKGSICPFFKHGEKCFSEMTTLKCYDKPCVNSREN